MPLIIALSITAIPQMFSSSSKIIKKINLHSDAKNCQNATSTCLNIAANRRNMALFELCYVLLLSCNGFNCSVPLIIGPSITKKYKI